MKSLTVNASMDNLPRVLNFIDVGLEAINISPKMQFQIELSVEEIFVNIVHFAYLTDSGEITIQYDISPALAEVRFIDQGKPYNPLDNPSPDTTLTAEAREIGGLGVMLVRKTMDELEYRWDNNNNILKIKKYIRGNRMKVLGIVGSKRKNGNTASLVKQALAEIKGSEIETDLIYLGDYNIKGCTGCEGCQDSYKCVIKDDMQKIYPQLLAADAIVIGSPTYFYNVTSDMKAFIDRLYCFQVFSDDDRSVWSSVNEAIGGKYALVIAICEQNDEKFMGFTAEAMSKPLEALGYRVVETVKILHLFKKTAASKNTLALEQAKEAGQKLKKTIALRKKTEKNFNTGENNRNR